MAPVQRSVNSNRQLAVRGSAAGTSRNSTRTVHGAPGMHGVRGRTSIPATAPAAGGAGGMTGRPSGSVSRRCGPIRTVRPPGAGGRRRRCRRAGGRPPAATTATSTATDSSHAQTRVRAARLGPADGGFPERSSSTRSGRTAPPGPAVSSALRQRPHERSELRTHGSPVEGGARRLQPLPDRRHTGYGQLCHCAVELVDEPGVDGVARADPSAACAGEFPEQGRITLRRSPGLTAGPPPALGAGPTTTRPSTSTVIRSTASRPSGSALLACLIEFDHGEQACAHLHGLRRTECDQREQPGQPHFAGPRPPHRGGLLLLRPRRRDRIPHLLGRLSRTVDGHVGLARPPPATRSNTAIPPTGPAPRMLPSGTATCHGVAARLADVTTSLSCAPGRLADRGGGLHPARGPPGRRAGHREPPRRGPDHRDLDHDRERRHGGGRVHDVHGANTPPAATARSEWSASARVSRPPARARRCPGVSPARRVIFFG